MNDILLEFPNGVKVGAMHFSDRKKPMLCIRHGGILCAYGSFTSDEHAGDFMYLLAQLIGADNRTGGKSDDEP